MIIVSFSHFYIENEKYVVYVNILLKPQLLKGA